MSLRLEWRFVPYLQATSGKASAYSLLAVTAPMSFGLLLRILRSKIKYSHAKELRKSLTQPWDHREECSELMVPYCSQRKVYSFLDKVDRTTKMTSLIIAGRFRQNYQSPAYPKQEYAFSRCSETIRLRRKKSYDLGSKCIPRFQFCSKQQLQPDSIHQRFQSW